MCCDKHIWLWLWRNNIIGKNVNSVSSAWYQPILFALKPVMLSVLSDDNHLDATKIMPELILTYSNPSLYSFTKDAQGVLKNIYDKIFKDFQANVRIINVLIPLQITPLHNRWPWCRMFHMPGQAVTGDTRWFHMDGHQHCDEIIRSRAWYAAYGNCCDWEEIELDCKMLQSLPMNWNEIEQ